MNEVLENYRDLQTAIDSEYQLNDGRHNFLLFFHALMFGLLGVLLSREAPLPFPTVSATDAVALAGIISAVVSGLSMYAGVFQIFRLKRLRQDGFTELADSIQAKTGASINSVPHWLGILPYIFYPPALVLIWIGVYFGV